VLAVEIWLWAACYLVIDLLPDLETALYFSIVTFSTIGYGDIVPARDWRVLAALEDINGFLFIGWSTAYLVAAGTRWPLQVRRTFLMMIPCRANIAGTTSRVVNN
jgi:hypothetical protein